MSSIPSQDMIWHYDGADAVRHHPGLSWGEQGLTLHGEEWVSGPHPWSELVQSHAVADQWIYGLRSQPGWRLIFAEKPPAIFDSRAQKSMRYGRWIDRMGIIPSLLVFSAISGGVVFAALRSPQWIAPYIPQSVEDQLGETIAGDIKDELCETPESKAALAKLVRRLGGDIELRQIAIARLPMINAITLPGRRVIIFHGLIQQAASPDELAGVLGHELGHVHNHDTMAALVRQFGLGVVFGGFNGNVASSINGLLGMSYSRDAERAADAYSVEALKRANISPGATAGFFDFLARQEGPQSSVDGVTSWIASHPEAQTRKAMFAGASEKGRAYTPALSQREWDALDAACDGPA